ncbi:hypothetical protein Tco_1529582 [Tanacetum coccineum]
MIPPTPPSDTESPVGSPISLSPSSSVGSSSPFRSTTPPPDYPFDESIFAELDNSLWIIPRPLESEPVPKKPNECPSPKVLDSKIFRYILQSNIKLTLLEDYDARNDDCGMPGWQSQGQSLANHT